MKCVRDVDGMFSFSYQRWLYTKQGMNGWVPVCREQNEINYSTWRGKCRRTTKREARAKSHPGVPQESQDHMLRSHHIDRNNLCRRHHQSQVVCFTSMVGINTLVIDLIRNAA